MTKRLALALSATFVLAALAAAAGSAGGSVLRGTITADGSSTVGPYTTAAAEGFHKKHPKVKVTVGISGTGGGFERFCRGEIDLRTRRGRSRHRRASVRGQQHPLDRVHRGERRDRVVVNKSNTWDDCLTIAQLTKMWKPGSKVDNWKDVSPRFPDEELKLFGPGTDSGTFDFFTEKINGRSKSSRSTTSASENDNVIVQGVAGEQGGLGYFGLSYYEENKAKLKLVKVNTGRGCVAPNMKTVQTARTSRSRGRSSSTSRRPRSSGVRSTHSSATSSRTSARSRGGPLRAADRRPARARTSTSSAA